MSLFSLHMQRLKAGASQAHTLQHVPEWIVQNTFLDGRPFSFSGHRYQIDILRDQSKNLVVIKPSQIGASEMISRMILAKAAILRPYNVIYTMPSAKAAQDFCKGRVSTIVDESPYLQNLVDKNNDSVTMKRIGYSLIHFKGAFKDAQAISIPADCVVADEYSYCDPTIVKQFQSRLTHSHHKHTIYFSTPLLPGLGIDREFQETRKHYRLCKCNHCNEWFWPQFLDHCRIPGHDVDWMSVTRIELSNLPWQETAIFCPHCGEEPDLSHEHREWVCSNPDSKLNAHGYHCTPFDVPTRIKPSYLAEKSVAYNRKIDWVQQNLGLAAEDKESSLFRSEVEACLISGEVNKYACVLGLDLGMESHATVLAVLPDVKIVVHTEKIPLANLVERYHSLVREWNIRMSTVDFAPYTDSVLRMQQRDPNLYACIYSTAASAEPYKVVTQAPDADRGRPDIRRVTAYRDVMFDTMMMALRTKGVLKVREDNDVEWIDHMLSMKRVKDYTNDGGLRYVWQKTDGIDHYAHSLVYALISSMMLGVSKGSNVMLPMISTFRVNPQE